MNGTKAVGAELHHKIASDVSVLINFMYEIVQSWIVWLFQPRSAAPKGSIKEKGLRIAVVGAGITGISAAAHCVGHGADVRIFEAGSRDNLGGIWSRVNSCSSLQVYSVMYRFHPTVQWHQRYPNKARILEEVEKLWHCFGLEKKTNFGTCVTSVEYTDSKWIINNDPSLGRFDGVLPCIGTCGDPKMPRFTGEEEFKGEICHSSQMDNRDVEGKEVVIVGGGASAIEVVENAVARNAKEIHIIARSDKWIIPRNIIVDVLLSLNIFGEETSFSFIPETLLRWFFYRDLKDMAPQSKGFYQDTPMVNDQILDQIRSGRCHWWKADIIRATENGLLVNHRAPKVPKGGPGRYQEVKGDLLVLATGFKRPNAQFLPKDCMNEPYQPPAWYLQSFPTEHPDICAINSMYVNGLGTVGNVHIGIYTRLFLAFLVDPRARPSTQEMRRWVSAVGRIKEKAPVRAFDYFTYSEMMLWFLSSILLRPERLYWAWFVFTGIEIGPLIGRVLLLNKTKGNGA